MSDDRVETDRDSKEELPPEGVLDRWEALITDMEATADEYSEEGWTVVKLHPGDVTTLSESHPTITQSGLDVIVPNADAQRVKNLVTDPEAAFDSCSVYRAAAEGIVFLVVVVEDPGRKVAVLYPAYYDTDNSDTQEMLESALQNGEIQTFVRDLSGETVSTFTHDDPELFVRPTED